jgi:hypothetical protein
MYDDSVLQEVRAAREAYARSHGYDVDAMIADLRRQDERGDWPVVRLAPRRPPTPVGVLGEPSPSAPASTSIPAADEALPTESSPLSADAGKTA